MVGSCLSVCFVISLCEARFETRRVSFGDAEDGKGKQNNYCRVNKIFEGYKVIAIFEPVTFRFES